MKDLSRSQTRQPLRFACTSCSLCCRSEALDGFERIYGEGTVYWGRKENGDCQHLTEEGLCEIYEDRPGFCRQDESFKQFGEALGIRTLKEAYQVASRNCNKMMDRAGVDQSLRIDVSVYDLMRG